MVGPEKNTDLFCPVWSKEHPPFESLCTARNTETHSLFLSKELFIYIRKYMAR